MTFIKNKYILILITILILGCKSTVKYRTIPLTTPPEKYYIDDYTTKKELYFEYQKSLMRIKEWQLWYNVNTKSDYYNYRDITNTFTNITTNSLVNIETNNTN